jgi:hypothetical protein
MVRSLWLKTLATSLVWTGVVCAQQPGSTAKNKQTDQVLTIQEAGKTPQKCQVVKSWRMNDGQMAYQVRAFDTGEMMTVTENAGVFGSRPHNTAMQIYHWGRMRVSPPGVPAPAANSPTITSYGVKSTPVNTARTPSPYVGANSKSPVPATSSPYPTNPNAAAKTITTPAPEKDWRQSWIQADERPLRIAEKPVTRESIAEAPRLKIEGKPAAKGLALKSVPSGNELPVATKHSEDPVRKKDLLAVEKQPAPAAMSTAGHHEPLLLPGQNTSQVLDITPRAKAPAVAADTRRETRKSDELTSPKPNLAARESVHARTLADMAGGTVVARPAALTIHPNAAPTGLSLPGAPHMLTSPGGQSAATTPAKATVKGEQQVVIDESKAQLDAKPEHKPSNKVASLPVIPGMPEPIKTPTPASVPTHADTKAGMATARSGPVVSEFKPVIPEMPSMVALPKMPVPAAEMAGPMTPLPHMEPARVERPSFLVMEARRPAAGDHAIQLPGAPTAVIAFGQPVTLTAPPPDMVRKKSLETHSIQILLEKLKDSLYPSQREWAAEGLTSANWQVHPEIVEALCKAATDDPAPTVRARCAHSLAQMEIRSAKALDTIHKLQADGNEAVRAQADQALKSLLPGEITHE